MIAWVSICARPWILLINCTARAAPTSRGTKGSTGTCFPSTLLTNKKPRFLFFLAAQENKVWGSKSKGLLVSRTVTLWPLRSYVYIFGEETDEIVFFMKYPIILCS